MKSTAPNANQNGGLFIPFYADMPDHPKIRKLSRTLNVPRDTACLFVLRTHHWAQKYATDGDLAGQDWDEIAEFVRHIFD